MADLPERARCVIIGGGVGGTAIAYHLTNLGWTDVVLLDRSELTSGSTFHSAGLVGQLRSSPTLTRMMVDSVATYRGLAVETGVDPGWREVGSLRLAATTARMEELRRQAGWAKSYGLPMELVSADEAQRRFPLMVTDGVLGAAWLPTDGYLDPSGLTQALAAGARSRGATILPRTRVTGIGVEGGRVTGVTTDRGEIAAEVVVNAGGMFAPEIGRMAGVTVPIIPFAHQYLVTEPIEGVTPDLPQLRDPDNLVYFRPEVRGLVMGGYERNPAAWSLDGIPPDFNGKLLAPDWPRFEEISAGAVRRVPAMQRRGHHAADQRPRGVHPRQRVHPGRVGGARLLRGGGIQRPRHRRRGRHGAAAGALDRRRRAGARPLEDGHPPLRGAVPLAAPTPSPARSRTTPPTTTSTTPTRSGSRRGRCASPRPTGGWPSWAAPSARSRAGSAQTGSSRTPRPAMSRSARVAGPGSTGRQPSAPSRSRPATPRRSSTRRASPRSRSAGPARSHSSSACATTRWTARSAASPTPRCSTGVAGSSATSP